MLVGGGVAVGLGIAVAVGTFVGVALGDGTSVAVGSGVAVDVGTGVDVGLGGGVAVGLGIGVAVGTGVGVFDGSGVAVSVVSGTGVDVASGVGLLVGTTTATDAGVGKRDGGDGCAQAARMASPRVATTDDHNHAFTVQHPPRSGSPCCRWSYRACWRCGRLRDSGCSMTRGKGKTRHGLLCSFLMGDLRG